MKGSSVSCTPIVLEPGRQTSLPLTILAWVELSVRMRCSPPHLKGFVLYFGTISPVVDADLSRLWASLSLLACAGRGRVVGIYLRNCKRNTAAHISYCLNWSHVLIQRIRAPIARRISETRRAIA